jgi:hypothetical protein
MTTSDDLPDLEGLPGWLREDAEALRDGTDSEKLEVLEELEGELEPEIVEEVIRVIERGGSSEVLSRAAIALGPTLELCAWEMDENGEFEAGDFGAPIDMATYERIQKLLYDLYADAGTPVLLRRRALEASIRSRTEWHEGAVRAAWASGDPDWRLTAVFCMGYFGLDFSAEISEAFHSDNEELTAEAIWTIGQLDLRTMLPDVVGVALDEAASRDLRRAAIGALGELGGDEARTALFQLTEESTDKEIVDAAEDALESPAIMMGELAVLDVGDDSDLW